MKITTTQHIRIEFDDGYVKELSEQDAKELHSELGKFLSKSYNEKDYPIMEWSKDWKTPNVFGPDPNIVYYYNQPTAQTLSLNKKDTQDLNVEIKTVDDNVVTKVGYENGTINGKPAARNNYELNEQAQVLTVNIHHIN